jgi:DNA-binding XRE family transcriptional regulator
MAERSLAASPKGLQQAEENLTDLRLSKVVLAQESGCARSTVVNFFAGKRVERQSFAAICKVLNLDWKTVADTPRLSLQATPAGIEAAKTALIGSRMNQGDLANLLEVSRQPIGNFFAGKPVSNAIFVHVCEFLQLDWQTIAGVVGPQIPNSEGVETDSGSSAPPVLGAGGALDIDALVQQARSTVRPLIQEQCGTMRVFSKSNHGCVVSGSCWRILILIIGRRGRSGYRGWTRWRSIGD